MRLKILVIIIALLFPISVFAQSVISIGVINVSAIIRWAIPELRVGASQTNSDAKFYISVYSSAEDGAPAMFTMTTVEETDNTGEYATQIPLRGFLPGTYDVIIKTHQHLSKKLNNVNLDSGINVLNFSTLDNSSPKGTEVLLGGDVSGVGDSPETLGDDVVNSVDLSIFLNDLNKVDPTGNTIRANLNQDTELNSVDMSIFLKNLDLEGESS